MRKLLALLIVLAICTCVSFANNIFVKPTHSSSKKLINQLISAYQGQSLSSLDKIGIITIKLPTVLSKTRRSNFLQKLSEYGSVEIDQEYNPCYVPNDLQPSQWDMYRVSSLDAWDITVGSNSVILAILDSGLESTHPEFINKTLPGWNIYDNNADTSPVTHHGTAVAGLAAADTDNGIGIASLGFNCKILPIRVSSLTGGATGTNIANGIIYAVDHGARGINVSFAAYHNGAVLSACQYAYQRGSLVSFAAGNDQLFISNDENDYCVVVGATDENDNLAWFSNYGNLIDVTAPGTNLLTTTLNGSYYYGSGTSYASPKVVGLMGLIFSIKPTLTAAQCRQIIRDSADDLGPLGWDATFGSGRINAVRAVQMARDFVGDPGPPPPPVDTVKPTATITSPTNGATVSIKTPVKVRYSVSDNVGVVKVELYVNSSLNKTITGTNLTSGELSVQLKKLRMNRGADLMIRAYDAAGNFGDSSIVTVNF